MKTSKGNHGRTGERDKRVCGLCHHQFVLAVLTRLESQGRNMYICQTCRRFLETFLKYIGGRWRAGIAEELRYMRYKVEFYNKKMAKLDKRIYALELKKRGSKRA